MDYEPQPTMRSTARSLLARRSSGVLLHPTSLAGRLPGGDLGPGAIELLDFLAAAGQRWWQMLPVGPPGYGDSPYQALSAHAGNPALISLERLRDSGLLSARELRAGLPPTRAAADHCPPHLAAAYREPLLERAFTAFECDAGARDRVRLAEFRGRSRSWLDDHALYRAIKRALREAAWTAWPAPLAARDPGALAVARRELARAIRYELFLQHELDCQWRELRRDCARRHVLLLGDVPIYVAHDSADVWARRDLFKLDTHGRPTVVAGVPPDYFSATGQLWGNPVYRWDRLARDGYAWWVVRLRVALERFDALRLDHFIGFVRSWEVPASAPTAASGRWRPGPGEALFRAVFRRLGRVPLVAEDLGSSTPEVEALRDSLELPGMRVLQFCFATGPGSDPSRPHFFPRRSVVYTGTHDNDTTAGWFRDRGGAASTRSPAAARRERALALRYLASDGREPHWDMIRLAFQSAADVAIVPAQDLLGLGSRARMNRPGTQPGNWSWRLRPGELDARLAARLRQLAETYGRAGSSGTTHREATRVRLPGAARARRRALPTSPSRARRRSPP